MTEYVKFKHSLDGVEVSRFGPLGFTCTFNVISEITCSKDSERSVRRFWNELTPKDASGFLSLVSDENYDNRGLKSSPHWPLGKAEFERSLGSLLTSRIYEHLQKMGFRKTSGDGHLFDTHVEIIEMGSAPPTPANRKESVVDAILAKLERVFFDQNTMLLMILGGIFFFVYLFYVGSTQDTYMSIDELCPSGLSPERYLKCLSDYTP